MSIHGVCTRWCVYVGVCVSPGILERENEQHQKKYSKHLKDKCESRQPFVTKIVGNPNANQHSCLPCKRKSSVKPHSFLPFTFDPSVMLTAGTQYWAYMETVDTKPRATGLNAYSGGTAYVCSGVGVPYVELPIVDLRFLLEGQPGPPQAVDDQATTYTGAAVTVDVLANDVPPEGLDVDSVDIEPGTQGRQTSLAIVGEGLVSVGDGGTVTFTPEPTFIGTVSFQYTVQSDLGPVSLPATVQIQVSAPAPPQAIVTQSTGSSASQTPSAYGQSFTIPGGTNWDNIKFNFYEWPSFALKYANGNLHILSSQFLGPPSGLSNSNNLVATSTGITNGQWTFDPSVMLTAGTQYWAYMETVDTKPRATGLNAYSGGTAYVCSGVGVPYVELLIVDLRFLLEGQPGPPQAVDDQATTYTGAAVTVDVLANDVPPEGLDVDSVDIEPGTQGRQTSLAIVGEGLVSVGDGGTVTFTPEPTFIGTVSFQYTVQSDLGPVSLPATVQIQVSAPAPPQAIVTQSTGSSASQTPSAYGQSFTIPGGTNWDNIKFNFYEWPSYALKYANGNLHILSSQFLGPPSGLSNSNNLVATSTGITNGQWTFDPSVMLTVGTQYWAYMETVDTKPRATGLNAYSGGTAYVCSGVGVPYVELPIVDLRFLLEGQPGPPQVVDDQATTYTGAAVTVDVLANDVPPEGLDVDSVDIEPGTQGRQTSLAIVGEGLVSVGDGGTVTFTPEPTFIGTVSFQYTVQSDLGPVSLPATVQIQVSAPAPPQAIVTQSTGSSASQTPSAYGQSFTIPGGTNWDNIKFNFYEWPSFALKYANGNLHILSSQFLGPPSGLSNSNNLVATSTGITNGQWTFDPSVMLTVGTQYWAYMETVDTKPCATGLNAYSGGTAYVCSGVGVPYVELPIVDLRFLLEGQPGPPQAVDDQATTYTGAAVTVDVLANDVPPEGLDVDSVDIEPGTQGRQTSLAIVGEGLVSVGDGGTVTFTPEPTFIGTVSFQYTVQSDLGPVSLPATVQIQVSAPAPPQAIVTQSTGSSASQTPSAYGQSFTIPGGTNWDNIKFNFYEWPSYALKYANGNLHILSSQFLGPPSGLSNSNNLVATSTGITNGQWTFDPSVMLTVGTQYWAYMETVDTKPRATGLNAYSGGTAYVCSGVGVPYVELPIVDLRFLLEGQPGPPQVVDDQATTYTGAAVTVDVLANDVPPEGLDVDSVDIEPGTQGRQTSLAIVGEGLVSVGDGGTVTFTPEPTFIGTVSFQYTVQSDLGPVSLPATVQIQVSAPAPPQAIVTQSTGSSASQTPSAYGQSFTIPGGTNWDNIKFNFYEWPSFALKYANGNLHILSSQFLGPPSGLSNSNNLVATSTGITNGQWTFDPSVMLTVGTQYWAYMETVDTKPCATGLNAYSGGTAYVCSGVGVPYVELPIVDVRFLLEGQPGPPQAVDDQATTYTGAAVTVDVLANDVPPEGLDVDSVDIEPGTQGRQTSLAIVGEGLVSVGDGGTVTFTPEPTFIGTVSFKYTVQSDLGPVSLPATVQIQVSAPAPPQAIVTQSTGSSASQTPSAYGQSFTIPGGTNWDNIKFNFYEWPSYALKYANGNLHILSSQFLGPPSGLSNSNNLVATSTGITNGQWTFDPSVMLTAGTPYWAYMETVDTKPRATGLNAYSGGTAYVCSGVGVPYVELPIVDLRFLLEGQPGPPQAVDDQATTYTGAAVTVDVLANDVPPEGLDVDSVDIEPGTQGRQTSLAIVGEGLVSVGDGGTVTFTPEPTFIGTVSFQYTVQSDLGPVSLPATVQIQVSAPAPPQAIVTQSTGSSASQTPSAYGQSFTIPGGTNWDNIKFNFYEWPSYALKYANGNLHILSSQFLGPPSGLSNSNNLVATSTGITNGQWTFDPSVMLTAGTQYWAYMETVDTKPRATGLNAYSGGTAYVCSGVGVPYVELPIVDLRFLLEGQPGPPQVVDDQATTYTGAAVTVDVLANDVPPEGLDVDSVDIEPGTQGRQTSLAIVGEGLVSVGDGGTVTFTPEPTFIGTVSFQYTVQSDLGPVSLPATVQIQVSAPAPPQAIVTQSTGSSASQTPSAYGQSFTIPGGTNWDNIKFNFYEWPSYALKYANGNLHILSSQFLGPPSGLSNSNNLVATSTGITNGQWTFDPSVMLTAGTQYWAYMETVDTKPRATGLNAYSGGTAYVCSGVGVPYVELPIVDLRFLLEGQPGPPQAVDDQATTYTGAAVTVDVLANDVPPEGLDVDSVDIEPGTQGRQTSLAIVGEGLVSVGDGGTVTFTPEPTFIGTVSFQYTVQSDLGPVSLPATVQIQVSAPAPPQAIVTQSTGSSASQTPSAYGQSFTIPGGTNWDNIKFNFYEWPSYALKYANGNLHILSSQFLGPPSGLSNSNNLVATSTGITNGQWTFDPSVMLTAGTQYWAYMETVDTKPRATGLNAYSGGTAYVCSGVGVPYVELPIVDLRFLLEGQPGPPQAVDDQATTYTGAAVTVDVLANDVPPEGLDVDSVDIEPGTQGRQTSLAIVGEGLVCVGDGGTVTFTPEPTFIGTVSFQYTVQSDLGPVSLPATVQIQVSAPAPPQAIVTQSTGSSASQTPSAYGQSFTIPGGTNWDNIKFNFYEWPSFALKYANGNLHILSSQFLGPPSGLSNSNNLVATSTGITNGQWTFDPSVMLTAGTQYWAYMETVDTKPRATGLNAYSGGTAYVCSGVGVPYVELPIVDLRFLLEGQPGPPQAVDDQATTYTGAAVTVDVLANDVPPEGLDVDSVDIEPGTQGRQTSLAIVGEGLVSVGDGGTVTFTPEPTFIGTVSFQYTVQSDLGPVSLPATVQIQVSAPAPPQAIVTQSTGSSASQTPSAYGQSFTIPGGTNWDNIKFNFYEWPSFALKYANGNLHILSSQFLGPPSGLSNSNNLVATSTGITNGQWTFDPSVMLTAGTQYWAYMETVDTKPRATGLNAYSGGTAYVCSGFGVPYVELPIVDLRFLLEGQPGPPQAVDDQATTYTGAAVTVDVLANDVPPEGLDVDSVDIEPGTQGRQTSLAIVGEGLVCVGDGGTVTFTPEPTFIGTVSFQYTVQSDLGPVSLPATVQIQVSAPAPPQAIVTQSTGSSASQTPSAYGQSFTIPGGTNWDNIKFNFYEWPSFALKYANGNLHILSSQFLGPPSGLSNSNNLVATSTGITNGQWTFDPSVMLTAGTQYWAYMETVDTKPCATGLNAYSGGTAYVCSGVGVPYVELPIVDLRFLLEGQPGPPQAVDDQATTYTGAAVTVDVLANDVPPEGLDVDSVDIEPGTQGRQTSLAIVGEGLVSVGDGGTVTFTPEPTFIGTVSFQYTVQSDLGPVSLPATVQIQVSAPAPPQATVTQSTGSSASQTPSAYGQSFTIPGGTN